MAYNKYGVSPKIERTYNGKVYDSKLEMQYRQHLELLRKAVNPSERVVDIEEQLPYHIHIKGKKICSYKLDFEILFADGSVRCIDVKGIEGGTDVYRIKKKLVEAMYGIEIIEVYRKDF